jgi:hypothetical protein
MSTPGVRVTTHHPIIQTAPPPHAGGHQYHQVADLFTLKIYANFQQNPTTTTTMYATSASPVGTHQSIAPSNQMVNRLVSTPQQRNINTGSHLSFTVPIVPVVDIKHIGIGASGASKQQQSRIAAANSMHHRTSPYAVSSGGGGGYSRAQPRMMMEYSMVVQQQQQQQQQLHRNQSSQIVVNPGGNADSSMQQQHSITEVIVAGVGANTATNNVDRH